MELSHKHHYIPKFLIKNFTDTDGQIYVYHKETESIKKQSPKGIFYEIDRNTFDVGGQPTDNLEKLYGALDNEMAKAVANVLKNGSFTPEELLSIVTLASTLKWRVPANDKEFAELKKQKRFSDLSVEIRAKDHTNTPIDEKVISDIENNSELIQEAKRVIFAVTPFIKNESMLLHLFQNSKIVHLNNPLGSLIGDVPLIEKSNIDIESIDSFILPLGSNDTFIYKKDGNYKHFRETFFLNRDLATFHLAKKYVACKDLYQLQTVSTIYKKIKADRIEDLIIKGLFGLL